MNTVITIPFHHQTITAIDHDGQPYIAMRPLVENLGLNWKSQHKKLVSRFGRRVVILETRDSLNRKQEMTCLPLIKLPSFLNTISVNKVKPELRERVALYQDECDEVLFNHFMAQKDSAFQCLLTPLFERHPQWQTTQELLRAGKTPAEIARIQHKHPSNVRRMRQRMMRAGIDCTPQTAA